MDRFLIQRKISDTLLGATYECSYNVAPQPKPTCRPRKPPLTAATPLPRKRASVVVKCSSLSTHEQLLVPTSPDETLKLTLDDPLRERAVVAALIASGGHVNVLQCYDHFITQEECNDSDLNGSVVCIVTEFCNGGDLFAHLEASSSAQSCSEGLGEHDAVSLMLQVARGVGFLQSRLGLAHRDLSLENVLLRDGTCKLADFGLAVPLGGYSHGRAGKQLYMAPEVVACTARGYDPAPADVWSLGVMLFMLLTGSALVDVASREDPRFVTLVDRGVRAILTTWGVDTSRELVELLDAMLSEDPTRRPSVERTVERLDELVAVAREAAERRSTL